LDWQWSILNVVSIEGKAKFRATAVNGPKQPTEISALSSQSLSHRLSEFYNETAATVEKASVGVVEQKAEGFGPPLDSATLGSHINVGTYPEGRLLEPISL
jgi:hypothetical protein